MEGTRVNEGGRNESKGGWKEGEQRRVEGRRVKEGGRKESKGGWKEGE